VAPDFDIADVRAREFTRLDATRCAYLDYAGASLYPESLVQQDALRLTTTILGNPHSENAPSLASTAAMATAREMTLQLLDADPREYDVVFTANASGAARVIAEAFPFAEGSRLVLTADNHNSVNGLRVAASRAGAAVEYVGLEDDLRGCDPRPTLQLCPERPSLFAFPAQSNFSGVRHPLEWIHEAHRRGYFVLLDAAAYVPTAALSLRQTPAEFVMLSYYKIFGYPTGIGALVARRDALALLRRAYFGGGTVQYVSVQTGLMRLKSGAEAFEDGTPSFLALPAVCDGLRWLSAIGLARIARHTKAVTARFLDGLRALGERVVIYGPTDAADRGGTVTFNLRRGADVLPYEIVEAAARERGIAVRGGCFCNPGAAEHAFHIPREAARECLRGEYSVSRFRSCLGNHPVGAIRASVGIASTHDDIDRLLELVDTLTRVAHTDEPWFNRSV
jgi:selenocysteine lyase/cysteine desulfurase